MLRGKGRTLEDHAGLDEADLGLIANKPGATRRGFALALKFASAQVKVDPAMLAGYAWSGRTAEYHRAQLRAVPGFRERVVGDEDKLADWLAAEVCPAEPNRDRLRLALLARCGQERIRRRDRSSRYVPWMAAAAQPTQGLRIPGTPNAVYEFRSAAMGRFAGVRGLRLPAGGLAVLSALLCAGCSSGPATTQHIELDPVFAHGISLDEPAGSADVDVEEVQ